MQATFLNLFYFKNYNCKNISIFSFFFSGWMGSAKNSIVTQNFLADPNVSTTYQHICTGWAEFSPKFSPVSAFFWSCSRRGCLNIYAWHWPWFDYKRSWDNNLSSRNDKVWYLVLSLYLITLKCPIYWLLFSKQISNLPHQNLYFDELVKKVSA